MATMRVPVAAMKVAQISKPGADFEIIEREIPKPSVGQVRIKVQACGVCHSDVFTKEGSWPGIQYPRVPDMKWWASSMQWVPVFPSGRRGSEPVSAGTVATTVPVSRAGAEIFAIAGI